MTFDDYICIERFVLSIFSISAVSLLSPENSFVRLAVFLQVGEHQHARCKFSGLIVVTSSCNLIFPGMERPLNSVAFGVFPFNWLFPDFLLPLSGHRTNSALRRHRRRASRSPPCQTSRWRSVRGIAITVARTRTILPLDGMPASADAPQIRVHMAASV